MPKSFRRNRIFSLIVACLLMYTATVYFNLGRKAHTKYDSSTLNVASFLSTVPGLAASPRMVIFDSNEHSGSLSFLSKPPKQWSVVVINCHDESQKETCPDCIYVSKAMAESFHSLQSSSSLSQASKIKKATYLHLLSCPETDWIYVTDRPYDIPYKALARVVDSEMETGTAFLGPESVFEPCQHFVDPVTWFGHINQSLPDNLFNVRNIHRRSIYAVVDECFPAEVTEPRWKDSFKRKLVKIIEGSTHPLNCQIVRSSKSGLIIHLKSKRKRYHDSFLPISSRSYV